MMTIMMEKSWLIPPRSSDEELLDQGKGSLDDVQKNLREMWLYNRYLGGVQSLTQHLYPRIKSIAKNTDQPITLLDIGSGGGELLNYIAKWAQRQHIELQLYGSDLQARHLNIAQAQRHPSVRYLQANALKLPLPPQSVDIVMSSLFLHHLEPDDLKTLLESAYARAKHSVIMNDLVRSRLAMAGFWLSQPIFARNYLTREDGLLSIKRAYRPDELLNIAHESYLYVAKVHTNFPFRMTLVMDK